MLVPVVSLKKKEAIKNLTLSTLFNRRVMKALAKKPRRLKESPVAK